MPGLFIAGTDTGVGKTLVTAALAAYLRSRGVAAGVMKPVETGVVADRQGGDAAYLKRISGSSDALDLINPYVFPEPLAPGVAASLAGVEISLDLLRERCRNLEQSHSLLLVEGAGGLWVPLTRDKTNLDLIQALGFPVLLVGRLGLGTVNHTLLSLECLQGRDIPVAGVVLNGSTPESDASASHNPGTISAWSRVPFWGTVPYVKDRENPEALMKAVESGVGRALQSYLEKQGGSFR